MWRHYYERWRSMTIDGFAPKTIRLVPDLAKFVPPARTLDKICLIPPNGKRSASAAAERRHRYSYHYGG